MRGFGIQDGYQTINIIVDGVSINAIDQVPQQIGSIPLQSICQSDTIYGHCIEPKGVFRYRNYGL